MQSIGWFDDAWQVPAIDHTEGLYLISNMCGNAYSLYHKGPWLLAALATYGQFHGKYGTRSGPSKQREEEGRRASSSSSSGAGSDAGPEN